MLNLNDFSRSLLYYKYYILHSNGKSTKNCFTERSHVWICSVYTFVNTMPVVTKYHVSSYVALSVLDVHHPIVGKLVWSKCLRHHLSLLHPQNFPHPKVRYDLFIKYYRFSSVDKIIRRYYVFSNCSFRKELVGLNYKLILLVKGS